MEKRGFAGHWTKSHKWFQLKTTLPCKKRYLMVRLDIPGNDTILIEHVVLDFNGTLALDGILIPGVAERLVELSRLVTIPVITADTNGTA
jgi:hypothetical protein